MKIFIIIIIIAAAAAVIMLGAIFFIGMFAPHAKNVFRNDPRIPTQRELRHKSQQ